MPIAPVRSTQRALREPPARHPTAPAWDICSPPIVINGERPSFGGYTTRPVLVDDVAAIGRQNDRVEAWSARTGERVWSWDVPAGLYNLVARGAFVYSILGPITIGDSSGERLWEFGGYVPPAGGSIYFNGTVAEDGTIYALTSGPLVGSGTFLHALRPPIAP